MIGDIENAMIARIKAAQDSGALGYTLAALTTYGGEISSGNLFNAVRNFPAIWVIFRDARLISSRRGGTILRLGARFSVICAATSLRSELESRQAQGAKPGSYQLVMDTLSLLGGKNLGLDINRLAAEEIVPLVNERSDRQLASIYGITFSTAFDFDAGENPSALDDFITFHANWDIPVHGNVGPDLPDDSEAEATDTVTLET